MTNTTSPIIRHLGLCHYQPIWQAMKAFTQNRTTATPDELWVLEHFPVFTQGLAGKPEHILNPGSISVIKSDRGGQVTYHGPGQLILYLLLDLKRHRTGIRQLVTLLEQAVIKLLQECYQLDAYARQEARGVYVKDAKICSIGLRVRKHYTYHGLALNVNTDTTPFSRINPCGFSNLTITRLSEWIPTITVGQVIPDLLKYILLVYDDAIPAS